MKRGKVEKGYKAELRVSNDWEGPFAAGMEDTSVLPAGKKGRTACSEILME